MSISQIPVQMSTEVPHGGAAVSGREEAGVRQMQAGRERPLNERAQRTTDLGRPGFAMKDL